MPEFVNPQQVLEQVGLKASMKAADFGCGSGGWTIPLAQILEDGMVMAVDVQEAPLSALSSRARLLGVSNIRKVLADVEEGIASLRDNSCDFVLITDLLFQVDEKEKVIEQAFRALKKEGKVLVVEWNINASLGPQKDKPSPEEIKAIAEDIGLEAEKEFKAGTYHFALLFVKR